VKIRNLVAGITLAAAAATSAVACSPAHADVYTPTAYGENYGGRWHCYYVHDAYEATQLIHAGHCHYGDVPTLMPLWWHERYYNYYSGGGYVNHFVLASYRPTYVNVQVNQFGRTYHNAIQSQSRLATWKSRSGKTVTGSRVKPRFSTKGRTFGGGSSRSRTSTGSGRSRTGQGSRSGSRYGGGSSRSGSRFGGGSSRRR
jgi:hypothetical protein